MASIAKSYRLPSSLVATLEAVAQLRGVKVSTVVRERLESVGPGMIRILERRPLPGGQEDLIVAVVPSSGDTTQHVGRYASDDLGGQESALLATLSVNK